MDMTQKLSVTYRIKIILLITVLLKCADLTHAQQPDSTHISAKNAWIENLNDKIALVISQNNNYETFRLNASDKYIIYPNTSINYHFNISYSFISFGVHYSPHFIATNNDLATKGKTKSFGFETSLKFQQWISNFSFSKVKGYYLYNTSDFANWKMGNYIQFPDLTYKGGAISINYLFNPRFSLSSLTSQTERQLKSAGSFLPALNLSYYSIDNQSANIDTQKSGNLELSIGPGYIHTFVVCEKYYLSLGLQSSLGYLNTRLTSRLPQGNATSQQDNFIFRWDGKTGIGYNGKKFYTGLYTSLSGTAFKQEHSTVTNSNTRIYYNLFIGFRLNTPEFFQKRIDKIQNKVRIGKKK